MGRHAADSQGIGEPQYDVLGFMQIQIRPYQNQDQAGIDLMMAEIAAEFASPITQVGRKAPPQLPDPFWVASSEGQVVGTIGLIPIRQAYVILKSMMVKKAFRGKVWGVSSSLMATAMSWCTENSLQDIYLGTMRQFMGAQQFYKKNGFVEIAQQDLPSEFLINPLDKVFFRRRLERESTLLKKR